MIKSLNDACQDLNKFTKPFKTILGTCSKQTNIETQHLLIEMDETEVKIPNEVKEIQVDDDITEVDSEDLEKSKQKLLNS